ncbi:NAD-dependent epimerase/dehydratase family protein [Roseomonas sp. USHLN139]|uniref:NAD-dependent epimerase/dehydratase family protein n=1 Tax=Roseomonas sp. USHLN139 TaxID=3081298 RepID=UPI003B01CF88
MADTILITGGAGFIGCHLARALLERGHRIRVLDALIEQVHGDTPRPPLLPAEVELIRGDVRDEAAVARALRGVDKVVHLAAEVGVGQSMYAVERYTSVNELGTAVLFQQLIAQPVQRVVVASSMSIYGEGLYRDADNLLHEDVTRGPRRPGQGWDPLDAQGRPLRPVPTPESKRPALASVYAIGKFAQERMTLTLAPAYGMEGVALRLWNAYGPGQALSNPYTGVLAIFAARLLHGQSPMIFEDGAQRRDFVHVRDVARAFVLALETPQAAGQVYNIGSGLNRSVAEVALALAAAMGRPEIAPEITGKARSGDIRHNIPDIGKAQAELGYAASGDFAADLAELAGWVAAQQAEDRVQQARHELEARGLVA